MVKSTGSNARTIGEIPLVSMDRRLATIEERQNELLRQIGRLEEPHLRRMPTCENKRMREEFARSIGTFDLEREYDKLETEWKRIRRAISRIGADCPAGAVVKAKIVAFDMREGEGPYGREIAESLIADLQHLARGDVAICSVAA